MVLEVYVPFAVAEVRGVFAEPERVARCLPGFQPGAEDPLRGARLRLRVAGSTITYRGDLTVAERAEGYAVEAEGTEARGTGAIRVALDVLPRPPADGEGGTTLAVSGTVEGTGRLAGIEPAQRQAAARRLLERFAAALGEELAAHPGQSPPPVVGGIGAPDDNEPAIPGIPAPEGGPVEPGMEEAALEEAALEEESELADAALEAGLDGGLEEDALADEFGERLGEGLADDLARGGTPVEPEADVARRTMIGRSAEEVDHAPPRGRYAPVPAPGRTPGVSAATLRWAAPAAALAVAAAAVVGRRLLRRRR